MNRWLKVVLVGLVVAAGAAAAQQGGEAGTQGGVPPALYDLTQGGAQVGLVSVDVVETEEGFRSSSSTEVFGLLHFEDELVTGRDGAARSYALTGTVRGIPVEMRVEFGPEGASARLTQAGLASSFELPSEEPLYVVDNNFLDGIQVLVSVAMRDPSRPLAVAIVAPQVAALGRASLTVREGTERVELATGAVEAFVLDGELRYGPEAIALVIWADDSGRILAVEQPVQAIRFELRAPDASEVDGPAAEARETAQELLERTAACVVTRELTVESAGATLYGELSLPVGAPPRGAPTLLLLPGSGPTDVDGNSRLGVGSSGYKQLAQSLGCAGYGVLRVAKMGIPPSTGDPNAATLQSYAQDVAAWFGALAQTEGVDADRLGLMGHSEGGLIALYAVAEGYVAPDVVVLLATAGRPLAVLLEEQVLASARRAGIAGDQLDAYAADVAELLEAVRASRGQTLEVTEELEDNQLVPLFAGAAGLLRSELDVDPTELASRVAVPTLVVQGLKDAQVAQVDGQLLAQALPRATHLELPDLTHNLVDTRLPAEQKLLPGPDDAVSATLVSAVATFLHGTLKLAR